MPLLKTIKRDQLSLIKPLWEALNQVHLEDPPYFKENYQSFTFKKRVEKFMDLDEEAIRIEVVADGEKTEGYCISTVSQETGEIDSLYIREAYRHLGYGKLLVGNGVSWLRGKGCQKIQLAVSFGHEDVLGFYRTLGFYPRLILLEQIEKKY